VTFDSQTGLTLFNAIATAGKNIYEIAQGVSKLETKQQLMGVYDTLMDLKKQVADLEDVNRELTLKLRFKSDDFDFRTPFYYEKAHPDRPLCPKCFSEHKTSPMSEPSSGSDSSWRTCLVCRTSTTFARHSPPSHGHRPPTRWG
jgi:hypothetical protein